MIIDVSKRMLEALGYRIIAAKSDQEAKEIYKVHHKEIDLVILDMIMPGMGGGDTFDNLKAIDPENKVILSSGYSLNGMAMNIMERGCRAFMQKPFGMENAVPKNQRGSWYALKTQEVDSGLPE